MQIVGVEKVDVRVLARAFSGRAEGQLAQPANFLQATGKLLGARVVHRELPARNEMLVRRQRLHLGL